MVIAERPGEEPFEYPETDDLGEGILQRLIMELLRPLVERYLAERGVRAFTGADQFFYWKQKDTAKRIAPDVYVLHGKPATLDEPVGSWLVWELERPPAFALEVVGRDVGKDYEDAPSAYASVGFEELVIFDPEAPKRRSKRVRWQVYRKDEKGEFSLAWRSGADRVFSQQLGCWLRAVGTGMATRVRVATGDHGDVLFLTQAECTELERAERERVEAQLARTQEALERAEEERARAEGAKAALEAEIARLRAENAALRAPAKKPAKRPR